MHERADRLAGNLVTVDEVLAREFGVAFSVLRQREDAEDVAQEAFAKAYRNFRQLRDRDRFRAWLVRMTWRMALDRQRANRRRQAREFVAGVDVVDASLQSSTGPETAAEAMARRERAEKLWQAIDALPEKLRLAIVLSGIEGHDIREVAVLLEVPEGTVKSRLFLARNQLRERLSWMTTER
jgi:RNA polymerase sigma-70 factor (ECF subfamily)